MRLVAQPPGSHCCGQAVVAMVLGITLEQSIELFGRNGKTSTKRLKEALRSRGVKTAERAVINRGQLMPPRCVLALHARPRYLAPNWGHWALRWDGVVYDPSAGVNPKWAHGVRVTSFLPLEVA